MHAIGCPFDFIVNYSYNEQARKCRKIHLKRRFNKMKSLLSFLLTLILLMGPVSSMAGRVYHWVDKNGLDHITEEPPPEDGRLKEVMEFTLPPDPPPKPVEKKQSPTPVAKEQESVSNEDLEEIMNEMEAAKKQSAEAHVRAEEAREIAVELRQRKADFERTGANTIRRRQKNKSILIRLENDAQEAEQLAAQAAEEARLAKERALRIEKKALERMAQQAADNHTPPQ